MAKGKTTLSDVAKLAGVSATAASFVLSGRGCGIPQATADRVWEASTKLGYAKASMAKLRDWIRVACVASRLARFNANSSFFAGVYSQLQRIAVKNRFQLFLMEFDAEAPEAEREKRIHEMTSLGIEVVLTDNRADIAQLQARNFKTVLVQSGAEPDCICVHCDDHEAGRLAAVHAIANGHMEAGAIFPPNLESHPRLLGFLKGMKDGGGACPERFRWTVPLDHAKASERIARLAASRKRPTLFYCFADNIAIPAMRGFLKAGLKIPDDVSLIGTENLYWTAHTYPAITTVDLLGGLFAEHLAEAVRDAVKGERPYCVASPVRLIARETVKNIGGKG